jgi:hypothetical protein
MGEGPKMKRREDIFHTQDERISRDVLRGTSVNALNIWG